MRFVIVSAVMPPSLVPEADYAWQLAAQLADRGHHVEVITTRANAVDPPPGVRIRACVRGWSWRGLPVLLRSIVSARPDVVVVSYIGWMYGRHPMITTISRLLARFRRRVRVVTVVHNVDHTDLAVTALPRSRRIIRALGLADSEPRFGTLISDSQLVLVGSHAQRDVLVASCPGSDSRVVVAPPPPLTVVRPDHATARAEGRQLLGLGETDRAIGFFGYRYPGKGVDTLVDAFAALARSTAGLKLVFVGGMLDLPAEGGVSAAARQRLSDLGLAGDVIWSGDFHVGTTQASTLLHALDVVALPFDIGVQLSNGSASTVLLHGIPLVTTIGGATDDEWRESGACVLVAPRDPVALSTALHQVLSDSALRASLQRCGGQLAAKWISWPRYLQRLEAPFCGR